MSTPSTATSRTATPDPGEGRRATRKAATRRALHDAARALMAERGFHATTVADIAAAAGVAPRTFFGYFPSKEAALYEPLDDLVASVEAALAESPDGDTFAVLRAWLRSDAVNQLAAFTDGLALVETLSLEADSVAVQGLRYMDRVTAAIATSLARDLSLEPGDALPELAAAAAVAAFSAGLRVGHHAGRDGEASIERMLSDMDDAERFVRAGLMALTAESSDLGAP